MKVNLLEKPDMTELEKGVEGISMNFFSRRRRTGRDDVRVAETDKTEEPARREAKW